MYSYVTISFKAPQTWVNSHCVERAKRHSAAIVAVKKFSKPSGEYVLLFIHCWQHVAPCMLALCKTDWGCRSMISVLKCFINTAVVAAMDQSDWTFIHGELHDAIYIDPITTGWPCYGLAMHNYDYNESMTTYPACTMQPYYFIRHRTWTSIEIWQTAFPHQRVWTEHVV